LYVIKNIRVFKVFLTLSIDHSLTRLVLPRQRHGSTKTATATEEIGGQIAAIQASTTDAVSSIQGIAKTIAEISEVATTVASAVEEQEAATREIADNIQQAAQGTQEVNTNISEVSRSVQETGSAASQVLEASEQLSQQAADLQNSISSFLDNVKAA